MPAILAGLVVLLIGGISISAIQKYDNVDDALKWWSGLSTIVGFLTGVVGTYFFKQSEVNKAEARAAESTKRADSSEKKAELSNLFLMKMTGGLNSTEWDKFLDDPKVKAIVSRNT